MTTILALPTDSNEKRKSAQLHAPRLPLSAISDDAEYVKMKTKTLLG
jgi:hypothetical protein